MIPRHVETRILDALAHVPAIGHLGPRHVGKTTMAHAVAASRPALYLDLESAADRARLANPETYLASHEAELVILEEIRKK